MYKPELVLENETHKTASDFEIQTGHVILTRRSDLVLTNKKERTRRLMDFVITAVCRINIKEGGKINKYLDIVRKVKKKKICRT